RRDSLVRRLARDHRTVRPSRVDNALCCAASTPGDYAAGHQIDSETLDQLYGYRISNIWNNRQIVDMKLQNNGLKTSWKRFFALTYVIEALRGRRFRLHTNEYFLAELFNHRTARDIQKKLLPSAKRR